MQSPQACIGGMSQRRVRVGPQTPRTAASTPPEIRRPFRGQARAVAVRSAPRCAWRSGRWSRQSGLPPPLWHLHPIRRHPGRPGVTPGVRTARPASSSVGLAETRSRERGGNETPHAQGFAGPRWPTYDRSLTTSPSPAIPLVERDLGCRAEGEGFEPSDPEDPGLRFSRPVHSTALPPPLAPLAPRRGGSHRCLSGARRV
jgi:hypothetical protein